MSVKFDFKSENDEKNYPCFIVIPIKNGKLGDNLAKELTAMYKEV